MTKENIICELSRLCESKRIFDDLATALGSISDFYETKYIEMIEFYTSTVFNLIIDYRGYPELDNEFDSFDEDTWTFATDKLIRISLLDDGSVLYIDSIEALADLYTNPANSVLFADKDCEIGG